MPITALPKATVHLLGSAQVLTTPTSLVKELIDNALDAKATSIDILVSKNTLDKLEVRDNGHGISSEDFDFLGKRGHTSKLTTFEELRSIGGVTLGFRGEALASAVELGDVSITTKTEGEAVATKLSLKAPGGVYQQTRASHPVGTTISVLKFMHKLPVRKKSFEKDATKTLAKISQLLRSYALARPIVRFSLKITNGGKGSWSFAPRPSDGIREAVSQVIGRDASLDCFAKSLTAFENQSKDTGLGVQSAENGCQETSQGSKECFVIEAFLPKPDADVTKIGTGQYLSIDSRPVSHEKGTMKKLVTTFKKYVRNSLVQDSEKLKNPFIRINIKCPTASYDANVEPAKDDVLFGNEQVVLDLLEDMFKEVYGDLKLGSALKPMTSRLDDFDLLLARETATAPKIPSPALYTAVSPQDRPTSLAPPSQASSPTLTSLCVNLMNETEKSVEQSVVNRQRNWGVDMSEILSEDVDDGRQVVRSNRAFRPHVQATPDLDNEAPGMTLNPWLIAKMIAPTRHDRATSEPNRAFEEPLLESTSESRLNQLHQQDVVTPLNPKPRQTLRSNGVWASQLPVDLLSLAVQRRSQDDGELFMGRETPLQPQQRNDFISARNVPEDGLMSPPPSQFPARNRGPNRPFVSPLATSRNRALPADKMVQTTLVNDTPRGRGPSEGSQAIPQFESSDVAWAMDFEIRKEDATRRLRDERHMAKMEAKFSGPAVPTRLSPHKNRYNAAVTSLEEGAVAHSRAEPSKQIKEPFKTTLPDGDPRAYLMRRHKSIAAKNGGNEEQTMMSRSMSRAKSQRLPLEKTPEEQRLHNLVLTFATNKDELQEAMTKLAVSDMYVHRGNQYAGLTLSTVEAPAVARKTKVIISRWMATEEGKNYEVEYLLDNLLHSTS